MPSGEPLHLEKAGARDGRDLASPPFDHLASLPGAPKDGRDDEQVETSVTRLTALLEPMLILIMVGIVLVIILSTLVPLLNLTSAIR